jgi:hypothetical protein
MKPGYEVIATMVAIWQEKKEQILQNIQLGNCLPDGTWQNAINIKFFAKHPDGSMARIEHHPENKENPWFICLLLCGDEFSRETTTFEDCFEGLERVIETLRAVMGETN